MTDWKPILDGADRERGRCAITAIVAQVREPRWNDVADYTLMAGEPGIALFLAFAARATGDPQAAELAAARIAELAERGLANADNLFLWTGLTGMIWAIERVTQVLDGADHGIESAYTEIDEALLEVLAVPEPIDFELLKGLSGLAVYALDRAHLPLGRRCLAMIVDRLAAGAQPAPAGMTWFTPGDRLSGLDAEAFPGGYHSLGLAHGCLGPLAVLGAARRRGIVTEASARALEGGVDWLLAQQLPPGRRQRFAAVLEAPHPAPHTGWCYGDPGVAATLGSVASAASRPAWQHAALQLAREVARRPVEQCGIDEPTFCHGAAGLAHILNRLYQATGAPELRDAARAWYRRLLDGDFGAPGAIPSRALLDGSAGVGLALAAAISDLAPAWDHAFLLGY